MKKSVVRMLVVLLILGVLVQTTALADPNEYSDVVEYLIASSNQDVTRDELIETYGTPCADKETYIGFGDEDQSTYVQYYFEDARLYTMATTRIP